MKKIYTILLSIIVVVVGVNIYLVNTYESASRRLSVNPEFTLTDMYGKTVALDDYKGKRLLVGFGYTNCVDICPVTLATLTNTLYEIEDTYPNAKYEYEALFISIDPERDTPEVLNNTIKDVFHDKVTGLTGTPEQIRKVADAFAVDYEKYGETKDGYYSMIHSVYLFVVDENGDYKTYFKHSTPPKIGLKTMGRYYKEF